MAPLSEISVEISQQLNRNSRVHTPSTPVCVTLSTSKDKHAFNSVSFSPVQSQAKQSQGFGIGLRTR